MAILKVKDENGNIIEIPAIQGKSAYEYAKDGGYTGTEEQFASKLATEYLKSGYEQYLYTGNTYNIQLELGGMFLVSFYSGYNVGALYLVQTGGSATAKVTPLLASTTYISITPTDSRTLKVVVTNANFSFNAIKINQSIL